MEKIFELYDEITGQTLSFHKTVEGAVTEMGVQVAKLARPLNRDYEDDSKVDFLLTYRVTSHEVKE